MVGQSAAAENPKVGSLLQLILIRQPMAGQSAAAENPKAANGGAVCCS
jgi:hypothetical protein